MTEQLTAYLLKRMIDNALVYNFRARWAAMRGDNYAADDFRDAAEMEYKRIQEMLPNDQPSIDKLSAEMLKMQAREKYQRVSEGETERILLASTMQSVPETSQAQAGARKAHDARESRGYY